MNLTGRYNGKLNVPMTLGDQNLIGLFEYAMTFQSDVKVTIFNPKMFHDRSDSTAISQIKVKFDFTLETVESSFLHRIRNQAEIEFSKN